MNEGGYWYAPSPRDEADRCDFPCLIGDTWESVDKDGKKVRCYSEDWKSNCPCLCWQEVGGMNVYWCSEPSMFPTAGSVELMSEDEAREEH